jgi:argininosuccinate lyase
VAKDVFDLFDLKQALAHRNLTGAPSPREVKKQLQRWKRTLAASS